MVDDSPDHFYQKIDSLAAELGKQKDSTLSRWVPGSVGLHPTRLPAQDPALPSQNRLPLRIQRFFPKGPLGRAFFR